MNEDQIGEEEVLLAIYSGDPDFKQVSPTAYQYKYGKDDNRNSLLIEIQWPENYPSEVPLINLDAFYNNHLSPEIKKVIHEKLNEKAEQYLGVAMTYTLFEMVKDNLSNWIQHVPQTVDTEASTKQITSDLSKLEITDQQKVVKKEKLSKIQKRKHWDRCETGGERSRGWDWVDIVKHLSQTGPKDEPC